jgi:hypothetical protein
MDDERLSAIQSVRRDKYVPCSKGSGTFHEQKHSALVGAKDKVGLSKYASGGLRPRGNSEVIFFGEMFAGGCEIRVKMIALHPAEK